MKPSSQLQGADDQLELLTTSLTGIYAPNGMGAMLFGLLAAAAQNERNYIREKTLEGQQAAATKGKGWWRRASAAPEASLGGDSLTQRSRKQTCATPGHRPAHTQVTEKARSDTV